MDITAETIQKVIEISAPEIHTDLVDANGRISTFSTKPLHEVKAAAPAMNPTVAVTTLAGVADLIRAELERADFTGDFVLHIEDERTVVLIEKDSDNYGRRLELVKAQPVPFKQFQFNTWQDQETFAIGVAALFADTPDKAYVLSLSSTLTNDATSTTEDDGFTQRAQVKAGMKLKETVTLKPRVTLAPYRTFPEVTQPASDFVFRARTMGDSPSLMLVEADGGRWKLEAIKTLKAALEAMELGVPIIA